jgi:hypothetical protein
VLSGMPPLGKVEDKLLWNDALAKASKRIDVHEAAVERNIQTDNMEKQHFKLRNRFRNLHMMI